MSEETVIKLITKDCPYSMIAKQIESYNDLQIIELTLKYATSNCHPITVLKLAGQLKEKLSLMSLIENMPKDYNQYFLCQMINLLENDQEKMRVISNMYIKNRDQEQLSVLLNTLENDANKITFFQFLPLNLHANVVEKFTDKNILKIFIENPMYREYKTRFILATKDTNFINEYIENTDDINLKEELTELKASKKKVKAM